MYVVLDNWFIDNIIVIIKTTGCPLSKLSEPVKLPTSIFTRTSKSSNVVLDDWFIYNIVKSLDNNNIGTLFSFIASLVQYVCLYVCVCMTCWMTLISDYTVHKEPTRICQIQHTFDTEDLKPAIYFGF